MTTQADEAEKAMRSMLESVPDDGFRNLVDDAAKGIPAAEDLLAQFYFMGVRVPRNYAESQALHERAAVQGFGQAQLHYGADLIPSDRVLAYAWLSLAAAHSEEEVRGPAGQVLSALETKVSPAEIAEAQRLSASWKPGTSIVRERAPH
jgi:TPR repeat protein